MGPAIVLETNTMPISESVPCQAIAARAPETTSPLRRNRSNDEFGEADR